MSYQSRPLQAIGFEQLPDSAFIRLNQLVGTVLPFSPATVWRKVRSGEFPKPVKLSGGITAWRVADVRRWLTDPAEFQRSDTACPSRCEVPRAAGPP